MSDSDQEKRACGRKEEVEKTESSIADTPDQNEWSVVVALLDELSTLRAKLAEVEKERDEVLRESNPRLEQAEIALREAFDELDSAKARIAEMGRH